MLLTWNAAWCSASQPQLLVLENALELAQQQQVIQAEIHAEQEHENGHDVLQVRAVVGHAAVADGKAAGAGGAERDAEAVEQRHAAEQQKADAQHGQQHVQAVQDQRRLAQVRRQLADARPGAFRAHQVHARARALARLRHDGEQEHEDAHAAEPVAEAAPVEVAARKRLHVAEDRGARRRKAGDNLKQRVDVVRGLPAEAEGQRAEQREHDPRDARGRKALLRVEAAAAAPAEKHQRKADNRHQHHRDRIGRNVARLPVVQGDQKRHNQKNIRQQHRKAGDLT